VEETGKEATTTIRGALFWLLFKRERRRGTPAGGEMSMSFSKKKIRGMRSREGKTEARKEARHLSKAGHTSQVSPANRFSVKENGREFIRVLSR